MSWQPIDTYQDEVNKVFLGFFEVDESHWVIDAMYYDGSIYRLFQPMNGDYSHPVFPTHWQKIPDKPDEN